MFTRMMLIAALLLTMVFAVNVTASETEGDEGSDDQVVLAE